MSVGKVFSWVWILPLTLAFVSPTLAQSPEGNALTLHDAVERALAQAPVLAAARQSTEEAGASARLARDAFHPQAWLTTTPAYASGFPVTIAGEPPAVFGFRIRQAVYDPTARSEALEAQARSLDSVGALGDARLETALAAITLYARVWSDQALLECARQRLSARQAILERVTALLREGRQTELDLERSRLEVARARQTLLDEQSESDLDLMEMRRLIAWPGGAPLHLAEDPLDALPEPAFADTLAVARAADPKLRALDQEVEILGRSAKLREKHWAPIIAAEARYVRLSRANNYDEFFNKYQANNWTIGFTVAVPLWSGGRLTEESRRAKAGAARAESEREARDGDLEIAVRRAEAAVERAVAQSSLARRAQGVAQEALRVARLLAEEGRVPLEQVEQEEIASADARQEVVQAGLASAAARARLLALRGQLPGVTIPSASASAARREAREGSQTASRETP